MIACLGFRHDEGDYTQVELVAKGDTGRKTLVCWLPAADAKKAKEPGVEISLKGQEGRWKLTATYATKPRTFITDNKMDRMVPDGECWA